MPEIRSHIRDSTDFIGKLNEIADIMKGVLQAFEARSFFWYFTIRAYIYFIRLLV